jgi:hypothetical protein
MSNPGSSGISPLRVGQLRALIVARTGRGPKAANNKDGVMKQEAAACINLPIIVRTPPPSPPRAAGEKDEDSASEHEGVEMLDEEFLGEIE